MATSTTTKIDAATVSKLAELADAVLSMDYARSFVYRANEDYEYFFGKTRSDGTPEPDEMRFSENLQFGNIWKGMDYAYRVVSNPKHRARALADLDAWPNVDVTDEHRQLLVAVLDKLATRQDADVITDFEYDDGFWQAFLTEYVDWIRTGEICQELIDDAFN
jgi:hypothetical protein